MIVFSLGAHPEVSLAELRIILGTKELLFDRHVAVFDVDLSDEEATSLFFRLGGSTRISRVITDLPADVSEERLAKSISEVVSKRDSNKYTLSLYGVRIDKKVLHNEVRAICSAKYDGDIREAQHSPAASFHVLKRGGVEFSVLRFNDTVLFLETVQLSDPAYWTLLDIERPGRDMKIGILPAKLARLMINLALPETNNSLLWDPFVGQGTIPMQAAILGIPIYGSDKSRQSIELCWQNMKWLESAGVAQISNADFELQAVETANPKRGVTAIATEPFLGKPHFKPYGSFIHAKKEWKKILGLYTALIKQAQRRLKPGQHLVFVKPQFAFLEGRKLEWYNPPLSISSAEWKIPEVIDDLGDLIWKQRDSVVARAIIVLEKK